MTYYGAKAFVRKYPASSAKTKRPVTMVLLLVDGDIPALSNESLHSLKIMDDGGVLTASVEHIEPAEQFEGYSADQIITSL